MQPCRNAIDIRRCSKASMVVVAKEETAIEFVSWKYRNYFELIQSESKNIVVRWTLCAANKTFSTVKIST